MSTHFLRAETLYTQKKYKLAIESYKEALKEEPENLDALRMLAMSLSLNQQDKDALREIKEAMRRAPADDEVIFTAGLIYYNANDHKKGEKLIKEALGKNPYNALAHLILSYIAEGKENWKLMREEAGKALEIEPNHEEALISLARAQRELGQIKEAKASLEAALLLNPNKAKTHAHLGRLLLHTGDPNGAREHLREALRLDPNNSEALEGFIESLRSKNILYYWFITCIWAISRGPARLVLYARFMHPCIAVFVFFFWYVVCLVREVTTFALRFDKDVRHYLPPELKKRNNRNLAALALVTAIPYLIGVAVETGDISSLSELKKAIESKQTVEAEQLEDKLYNQTMASFKEGSLYGRNRAALELLYKYELDRRPQDKSRLAYTAIWLGTDDSRGAYPNLELIDQAQSLARATNDGPLYKYCQIAMSWGKYLNLNNRDKIKVQYSARPNWRIIEGKTAD
ncbi:MAG: tetratricopeptide repeat protein [Candidatus Obscuribacter sp.]|nr:tetratricopeptide repeat protein [Candidatus Obscuribacter sp.]